MVLKDSDSNAATLLDLDTEAALPLWFEICFCRLPPKTYGTGEFTQFNRDGAVMKPEQPHVRELYLVPGGDS